LLVFPLETKENDSFKYAFTVLPGYTQAVFWDVDDDVVLNIEERARVESF